MESPEIFISRPEAVTCRRESNTTPTESIILGHTTYIFGILLTIISNME